LQKPTLRFTKNQLKSINHKIVIILKKFPFGGAERQAKELLESLLKTKYRVDIISIEGKTNYNDNAYNVISLNQNLTGIKLIPPNIFRNIVLYYKLYKIISGEYDVVISYVQLYLIGILNKKCKTIISIRMFYPNSIKIIKRYFLRKFDMVISNNLPQYSLLHAMKIKSILINNVIQGGSYKKFIRKPDEKFKCLVVSNYSKRKNIDTILKAFKRLNPKHFSLTIIGNMGVGQYLNEFRDQKNITIVGHLNLEDIEKYYENSDCLIHASYREGASNAILDAMRFQLPVIASKIPENISLIGNNSDYLFEPNSHLELTKKIENVFVNHDKGRVPKDYLKFQQDKIKFDYNIVNNDYLVEEIKNCINKTT
jgi:glycosyltransferase involved in cell wall biosynthesis